MCVQEICDQNSFLVGSLKCNFYSLNCQVLFWLSFVETYASSVVLLYDIIELIHIGNRNCTMINSCH